MFFKTRFIGAPDETVVVVDVPMYTFDDRDAAMRLRKCLSRSLGELPVLLRCSGDGSLSYEGEPHLHRFALDPVVDAHPVVNVEIPLREAA